MKYMIVILEFIACIVFAASAICEDWWNIVPSVCCGASAIIYLKSFTNK